MASKFANRTSFKKGQSGNPKGKKPGTKDRRHTVQGRVFQAALADANAKRKKRFLPDLTPLGFMQEVLQHPDDYPTAARMWAAEKAAPYMHKRMPIAIEGGDKPIAIVNADTLTHLPDSELEKLVAALKQVVNLNNEDDGEAKD